MNTPYGHPSTPYDECAWINIPLPDGSCLHPSLSVAPDAPTQQSVSMWFWGWLWGALLSLVFVIGLLLLVQLI